MRAGLVGRWRAHERIPPEVPVMQVTRGLLAGGIFLLTEAAAPLYVPAYRLAPTSLWRPAFFFFPSAVVLPPTAAPLSCQVWLPRHKPTPWTLAPSPTPLF